MSQERDNREGEKTMKHAVVTFGTDCIQNMKTQ